ncbi:MAG: methionyl-tRNA formyltransferase [PS1 clade bacterium]|nr:methionyl-tRNA formyltransferase [PS1 clade bacterium]
MAQSIVFMGTPDFAVPAFDALCATKNDGYNIVAVYTRPPAKKGRGMQLTKSPVHQAADAAGIEVFTPTSLKDNDELARFQALQPDLAVVVAYGMILPQDWLDTPRRGCWNIHASLLPRWRGAAPIQRAIMAGDAETGVAIMQMAAGLDTGPVLLEKRTAIAADDTAQSLHDKLARLGGEAIGGALAADDLSPHPQPEAGVTYAEKIDKAEARIDFTRPATDLDPHIRGLSPFPGAWFQANGKRVKILAAKPVAANGDAATVSQSGLIYCGIGALQLVTVQPAGKAAMSGADFLRGRGLVAGQKLDR